MKKQIIILALSALVLPAFAQETNEFHPERGEKPPEWEKRERPDQHHRRELSPEEKAEQNERRLKFMKKSLKDIGVTEEQQQQIFELQQVHQEKMREVSIKSGEARKKLSQLQDEGASEAELDAAIDDVAATQAQQLKILVRNRMEMEKILGKEKNAQLMENARSQFRKHGRRSGGGMPPRPGLPPLPTSSEDKTPPLPDDA